MLVVAVHSSVVTYRAVASSAFDLATACRVQTRTEKKKQKVKRMKKQLNKLCYSLTNNVCIEAVDRLFVCFYSGWCVYRACVRVCVWNFTLIYANKLVQTRRFKLFRRSN